MLYPPVVITIALSLMTCRNPGLYRDAGDVPTRIYDTMCKFNAPSRADRSQLTLPHETKKQHFIKIE